MNLKLLLDVLALIEEQSFTAAAQRRNVTQPAFSRRIQAMESWLGQRLVARAGPHVHVLPAALRAEPRVRSLVNQIQGLRRSIEFETMQKRHAVFTMPHTHSIYLFARLIQAFRTEASRATHDWAYSLKSGYKSECIGIFMRGDADILICDEEAGKTSIPSSFQYRAAKLGSDLLIPVAMSDWWSAVGAAGKGQKPIPVIAYPQESYLWSMISDRCLPKLEGSFSMEIVCETALSAAVREMVLHRVGIGWLPRNFVAKELESGLLLDLVEDFGAVELEHICYISKAAAETDLLQVFEALTALDLQSLHLLPKTC